MTMTRERMHEIGDRAAIHCAIRDFGRFRGNPSDRLPPRLWEDFRVELQRIYRAATGEEFAVLKIEGQP